MIVVEVVFGTWIALGRSRGPCKPTPYQRLTCYRRQAQRLGLLQDQLKLRRCSRELPTACGACSFLPWLVSMIFAKPYLHPLRTTTTIRVAFTVSVVFLFARA